ncbi:DUF4124 domain-containing protein [Mangrovitalea sediminis]|uniref:DUF4124 domain-containing protein n=1 Tax=Mangrovitalea sediminis TaxID=1982043 RepID=UPI000BE5F509|nr:DUF4124 domain-containing protein [Mangrovitalea sediminis]
MIKVLSKSPATLLKHIATLSSFLLLGLPVAQAATLYRYIDSQGHPAISGTVPDDAVKRGYEILSPNGRVIKTIPPAPTAAELKAKMQAEEARKAKAQEIADQKRQDEILLRNYSSPDDAIRELHRQLQEMNSLINLKRGNIAILQSQLEQEQEQAGNLQRAGRTVPKGVLEKMQQLQKHIRSVQLEIAGQKQEIDNVEKNYREKVTRLEQLTGEKPTLPFALPLDKTASENQ